MTVERPKTVPNVTARSRLGIPEILDGSVVYMVVRGLWAGIEINSILGILIKFVFILGSKKLLFSFLMVKASLCAH